MRSPVGGLFRHVIDLVRGQISRGHAVGIVADAATGGGRADAVFSELAPDLALGLTRVPMSRHIGMSDLAAWRHVGRRVKETGADVVHGHGAKGGAYARLAGSRAVRVYTPHGGSLHYDWRSPVGFLYLALERALIARTDVLLLESAYARDTFRAKVGGAARITRVVHNGVTDPEFVAVEPVAKPTDIVFVGELRLIKGVDVLIEAIGLLAARRRRTSATIVGAGPDEAAFKAQVEARGLGKSVQFPGPLPAREAFARGRLLVVPSRAESLPYIVLEAAAAGVPIVTTRVGGIPEIFGPLASRLVPPGDAAALAGAISAALSDQTSARADAQMLHARVRARFSADAMTDQVLAAYREALVSLP